MDKKSSEVSQQKLDKELKKSQEKLAYFKNINATLYNETVNLKEKLAKYKGTDEKIKILSEGKSAVENDKIVLENDLDKLNRSLTALKERSEKLSEETEHLKELNDKSKTEYAKIVAYNKELSKEQVILSEKLSERDRLIIKLRQDNKDLNDLINTLKDAAGTLGTTVATRSAIKRAKMMLEMLKFLKMV